jgi:hypothetical protein
LQPVGIGLQPVCTGLQPGCMGLQPPQHVYYSHGAAGSYLCARMAEVPTAECSAWPMELDGCQPDGAAARGGAAGAAAQL